MSRERWIRGTVASGCLAAWLFAPAAHAQITNELTFTTTFPFTVGNSTMPAGAYEIKPVDNEPNIIEVSAVKGGHSTFVEVVPGSTPAKKPDETKVTFKQYKGGGYVLKSIWDQVDQRNVTTAASYAEKKHASKDPSPTDQDVTAAKSGKR